jgi:hypothetical protein
MYKSNVLKIKSEIATVRQDEMRLFVIESMSDFNPTLVGGLKTALLIL